MADKQRVIDQARRILGSYEQVAEEVQPLARSGGALASDSPVALEGFIPRPPGRPGAGGPAGATTTLEAAIAAERTRTIAEGLEAMKKIDSGREQDITPQQQTGLEAIVLLTGRPAILVQNDDFLEPPKKWAVLKDIRDSIRRVLRRVGRIDVSGSPNFDWLGTGFLAGQNVVLTNRHVAVEFARTSQQGGVSFRPGMGASVNLRAELGSEDSLSFTVTEILGIHEEHDLAALKVEQTSGTETLPDPLPIAANPPGSLDKRQVYVVGYPAWDGRRNDPEPMKRIFSEIYNVKRLQPGEVAGEGTEVLEFFHDCSTLGGNSGSPVVDLETHRILGLHFGGRFLQRNHAVPLWKLQTDALVKRARLNFV
jgi:hypothetical protein